MKIMSPAKNQTIRCLRCGNSYFPQGLNMPVVACPVVGCNYTFNPMEPPLVLDDPEAANIIAGTADPHLLFGRDDMGEVIVIGLEGSPTTVSIPTSVNGRAVMGIAPRAFADQTQLRRVTMPDTLATIGEEAFAGCTDLESVTFGKGLTLLDKACFRDCTALDCVILPANLEEIGRDAFARCTALEQVTLKGQVAVIRDGAFTLCSSLSCFDYAQRPQRIASSAFAACYALPQSVQDELFPQG